MTDLISREAVCKIVADRVTDKFEKKAACHGIRALPAVTPATVGVPTDCRRWTYYPIQMPFTKDGKGPATIGVDAESISYEVWDCVCNSYASFDNLPDAINEAMRLSIAALTPNPVDASQTPDPVVNDHQYSPSMNPNDAGDCRLCGASMSAHFVTSGAERRWIEDTEAGLYDDPVLSDPRVKALVEALRQGRMVISDRLAVSTQIDAALRAIGGEE